MEVAGKIKELAESVLQEPGHFIVDVIFIERQRRLMVFLDGDNGVNIDQCADLSRKLSAQLDEQNILGESSYVLEVSTPGLDHPLKIKRQYFKNKGRQVKVHLKDKSILQGKLEDVSDERLVIHQAIDKKETKVTEVAFDQIEKAFVMVSFKHN